MWLDMWILPNYIEAERAGCLQSWLQEFAPQGSANIDYQTIAGGRCMPQILEEDPLAGFADKGIRFYDTMYLPVFCLCQQQ